MFEPLVFRVLFGIDGNADRINHVPDTVVLVHVNILDDASVHLVEALIVFF
jgi:hypothetical protein